ncbi:MAG: AgmX/PglI C-terminal domain-containing protein [Myxococcales bacterium]|nr:AgmX/PglI C-terminal domain-containing protein [Myxococcales bacterium]
MNCREIRERLAEGADEVRNQPDIAAHLGQCDACRAFAQKISEADRALRDLAAPRLDPALVDLTLRRVESTSQAPAPRRRLRFAWMFATGSVLLLLGGFSVLFLGRMRELVGVSANALAGNEESTRTTELHGHRNIKSFGVAPASGPRGGEGSGSGWGSGGAAARTQNGQGIGGLAATRDDDEVKDQEDTGKLSGEKDNGVERRSLELGIRSGKAAADRGPANAPAGQDQPDDGKAASTGMLAVLRQPPADRFVKLDASKPAMPAEQPAVEENKKEQEPVSELEQRRAQIIPIIRNPEPENQGKPVRNRAQSDLPSANDVTLAEKKNLPWRVSLARPAQERTGESLMDGKRGRRSPAGEVVATTPRDALVMGSLDKSAIRQVIQRNLGPIQNCFSRALQSNPNAGGKGTVTFTIQPDGNVSDVDGRFYDAELGRCVAAQVERWQFPVPKGGGVVRVTYPFVFKLAGDDAGEGGEQEAEELAEPPETPLEQLTFIPARGYFENTYLPGDPELEWLRERLSQLPGGVAFDLVDAIRPYRQPFDAPAADGLAVFLAADQKGVEGPARLTLQVGLKGSLRHAQRRSAVTAALVVDLTSVPDEEARRSLWTLADALAGEIQAGDRFFLVVAGVERPLKLKPAEFSSLAVRRALALALEEREAKGAQGSLEGALQAAYDAIRGEGGSDAPLGANLVLLLGAGQVGEDLDQLSLLAHTRAVDGIGLTTLGVGGAVDVEGLRSLALSGQGRFRVVKPGEERQTIEGELAASGSVVARAIRLRIRLAPGVKLISVLGSRSLDAVAADRVRQAERAIDQRVSRTLGIEADRGDDEDGIQIVIPAFFAGDDHVILLDVVVPGPGPVADVRARYKDLVNLKNAVSQASLVLAAGERPLDPLSINVQKNLLAFHLAQDLRRAAQSLDAGQAQEAAEGLRLATARIGWLLRRTPELQNDPELRRDQQALALALAELRERIDRGGDLSDLVITLAYTGRTKLPPRRAETAKPSEVTP